MYLHTTNMMMYANTYFFLDLYKVTRPKGRYVCNDTFLRELNCKGSLHIKIKNRFPRMFKF